MWVMQFTAKYAALVVTKALALQFAQTLREAIIYLAAEEARRQLEARGAFDRVNRLIENPPEFNTGNPNVDKALRLARPLATAMVIDTLFSVNDPARSGPRRRSRRVRGIARGGLR